MAEPKSRAGRKVSRGHPFLAGRPKGVYYPDAVGIVPGYPKTHEKWVEMQARCLKMVTAANAAGTATRKGVPDGWAGRKAEAAAIRAIATEKAEVMYDDMVAKGVIDAPAETDPGTDDGRAEVAMKQAIRFVLDETENSRERLTALKTVLEFTRPKPVKVSEVTLNRAEDFLTDLINS